MPEVDPSAGGPLDDLIGHSVTYRVAIGPRAGQKVFTLQTLPAELEEECEKGVAFDGFPLGYEVFAGNTHDSTTLKEIVETMERRSVSIRAAPSRFISGQTSEFAGTQRRPV